MESIKAPVDAGMESDEGSVKYENSQCLLDEQARSLEERIKRFEIPDKAFSDKVLDRFFNVPAAKRELAKIIEAKESLKIGETGPAFDHVLSLINTYAEWFKDAETPEECADAVDTLKDLVRYLDELAGKKGNKPSRTRNISLRPFTS